MSGNASVRPEAAVLDDVIATIYEAAIDPTIWPEALYQVGRASSAADLTFALLETSRHVVFDVALHGIDAADGKAPQFTVNRWQGGECPNDNWPWDRICAREQHAADYDSLELFRDGGRYLMRLPGHDGHVAYTAVRFASPQRYSTEPFVTLAEHLVRAQRSQQRLARMDHYAGFAIQMMDHVSYGLILLDENQHVLMMNDAADTLLRDQSHLVLEHDRLRIAQRKENTRLKKALAGARPGATPQLLIVARAYDEPPLLLMIMGLAAESTAVPPGERPAVAILVSDPGRAYGIPQPLLQCAFGLTPTEARLASLLAEGMAVDQASAVMKASPRTVRLHLEHIFEKTNLHRQQDLVRALVTLPKGFSKVRSF